MKDRVIYDIGAKESLTTWESINWESVCKRIKNLRQRIFRASPNEQWNKVRSLMKLMIRSFSNILLSISNVTQINVEQSTVINTLPKVLNYIK